MTDIVALDKLEARAKTCTGCPLHQSRGQLIFGQGNKEAPIMLVGEAPGTEEDRTGIAFSGKSGQLLDKILATCNFERDEHIYISNIIKCHPPGNRKPSPSEMKTCVPILMRQITLIQPKIIVLLGSVAIQGLIWPNAKITRERGKWNYWLERWVMPTYHPSALLRNPKLKYPAWDDFKEVVRKYRELVDENHVCQYV